MKTFLSACIFLSIVSCMSEPKKVEVGNANKLSVEDTHKVSTPPIYTDTTNKTNVVISKNQYDKTESLLEEMEILFNSKSLIKQTQKFYLSKSDKLLTIGNSQYPLELTTVLYDGKDRNDGFGPHHIEIRCISGSDCIYTIDGGYAIAISAPFATFDDAMQFIKLYDNLKLELLSTNI